MSSRCVLGMVNKESVARSGIHHSTTRNNNDRYDARKRALQRKSWSECCGWSSEHVKVVCVAIQSMQRPLGMMRMYDEKRSGGCVRPLQKTVVCSRLRYGGVLGAAAICPMRRSRTNNHGIPDVGNTRASAWPLHSSWPTKPL